jgi:hypothetical protein
MKIADKLLVLSYHDLVQETRRLKRANRKWKKAVAALLEVCEKTLHALETIHTSAFVPPRELVDLDYGIRELQQIIGKAKRIPT